MTNLPNTLNLINYAFVLFFGITVSLCLADISFRKHRKTYLLSYLCFGIGQVIFYLVLGENRLYQWYPLLIPSATDPAYLFWTEKKHLRFHGGSFVCLSDVYSAKMGRHICIQLF